MSFIPAQRIVELRKELIEHSFRYYVSGYTVISDQEYDQKMKELIELEREHPEMADPNSPTMRVGSILPTSMKKTRHNVKMLSLDNVNNLEETMAFFKEFTGQEVTVEMKIDGLSLSLAYEQGQLVRAVTRGNGVDGELVTENARTIRTLPLELRRPVDIEVRGEVYWRISKFNAYNASVPERDRYANPRNGASGIMRSKESKDVAQCKLDFVAYSIPSDLPPGVKTQEGLLDYLETLGFVSTTTLPVTRDMAGLPYLTTVAEPGELMEAVTFLKDYRSALDLDTDGLVIKLSSIADQRDVGEGTKSPKWAAAYKFPPESKPTRLLKVTLQVGKSGQIAPVAELEPVELGGVMVRRTYLCNQDELDRLGIDVGDYVLVQRSGEVIPKIIGLARPSPNKVDQNKSFQMSRVCPCCSTPLIQPTGMVNLFCPNHECYDQVLARLAFAVSKDALDIKGFGEGAVQTLMNEANVKRLSDLYAIKSFSALKPATAQKVKEGLEKAKAAALWRKLSALSIEGIGKVSCQDLTDKYCSLEAMIGDLAGVTDIIGEVATQSLLNFVSDDGNMEEIERLAGFGFTFIQDRQAEGPLSGKSFCITGDLMSGRRNDVSALIERKGGAVKGAVTKKVDYLIQGLGGGQRKAAGCVKWGTKVISEEELYQMIGEPMPVRQRAEIER
jgi:DNA ligase (NAD+)